MPRGPGCGRAPRGQALGRADAPRSGPSKNTGWGLSWHSESCPCPPFFSQPGGSKGKGSVGSSPRGFGQVSLAVWVGQCRKPCHRGSRISVVTPGGNKAGSSKRRGDGDSAHPPCAARRALPGVPCQVCAGHRCPQVGGPHSTESRIPPTKVPADAGGAALWGALLSQCSGNWSTDFSFQNSFCKKYHRGPGFLSVFTSFPLYMRNAVHILCLCFFSVP